ncbi:hypothetical protein [Streptomyces sp. 6N223]|uniref:hypothetical protein n=1 Tax=Streptomyces sp. 6N223 TaxID=3457412 RepID=UPI003FD62E82
MGKSREPQHPASPTSPWTGPARPTRCVRPPAWLGPGESGIPAPSTCRRGRTVHQDQVLDDDDAYDHGIIHSDEGMAELIRLALPRRRDDATMYRVA